jgi:hypothetical protein
MKIFFAVMLYALALFSFLQGWLLTAIVATVLYSIQYGALVFIPAAILMDGYFGNFQQIPHLSIVSILWFVSIEYVRPRIAALSENKL